MTDKVLNMIKDYLNDPKNTELVNSGNFYEFIFGEDGYSGLESFVENKYDYFGRINDAAVEILLRSNLFKNATYTNNKVKITLDKKFFDRSLADYLATDSIGESLFMDKNPFNYNIDKDDLIEWVLNKETFGKIFDKQGNLIIPQEKLEEIETECAKAFNSDVADYWWSYINYTYFDDGSVFDRAGFDINYNNDKVELITNVDSFINVLRYYNQTVDSDNESIYNGNVGHDYIEAILASGNAQVLSAPYNDWAGDVEFDQDYGADIVNRVLNS